MTWGELCQANKKEGDAKTMITKARSVKNGQSPPPHTVQEVTNTQSDGMSVRQSFTVLSEAELRKVLNKKRLTKKLVEGVPQVTLPNGENVFVFKDPDKPYRTLELVSSLSNDLTKLIMPRDRNYHDAQGKKVQEAVVTTARSASGETH
eukprot:486369-Pyramimonas_sp.AAC.1